MTLRNSEVSVCKNVTAFTDSLQMGTFQQVLFNFFFHLILIGKGKGGWEEGEREEAGWARKDKAQDIDVASIEPIQSFLSLYIYITI